MSTRALTVVYNNYDEPLVVIYCYSDGYPEGHGADLAKTLKDRVIVNGIEIPGQKNASNGMGCLAATIVAKLKKGIGEIYLRSDSDKDYGQDYEYHIWENRVQVFKDIGGVGEFELMFKGTWNEFYNFCVEQ